MTARYEGGVTEIPTTISLPPEGVGGSMGPVIGVTAGATSPLTVASLPLPLLLLLTLLLGLLPPSLSLSSILLLVPGAWF